MIASTCLEVVFLILFTVSDNSAFSRGPDSHVEHEAEQILGDNGGDRHPKKDFSFAMKMPGAQSVKVCLFALLLGLKQLYDKYFLLENT